MTHSVIRFFYNTVLVLGLLALSACTIVGPEYEEPQVDWLQNWQPEVYKELSAHEKLLGKKKHLVTKKNADTQFWWYIFNDAILNKLIEQVRQENHSLRIAGLRIFESRALLGIADSSLYPQLQQLSGSAAYVNNQSYGGNSPNQSFSNYQTGFNLGWELDFWGRFQRGIESANAAFFASVSNQQDVQVLLYAQLTNAYFSYRSTQFRIKIAHENAEVQKRS